MAKKIFQTILRLLNYLAVTLMFLFLAVELRAFDIFYYKNRFEVNNTVEYTGKTIDELNVIAKDLINYLITGNVSKIDSHFSSKEVLHMLDVYHLFYMMYVAQIIIVLFLVLSLVYAKKNNVLHDNMLKIRKHINITYCLVVVGAILFLQVDFTRAFIYFHKIFFSNDLWILDPRTDLMIQMLPENFFSTMALQIFILWILMNAIAQIVITVLVKKFGGKNSSKNVEAN